MATRIVKGGLQSYDPEQELKNRLGIGATQGAATPPPITQPTQKPAATAEQVSQIPTLTGRLEAAGVAPRQGGMMSSKVGQPLAETYAEEAAAEGMQGRIGNIKNLTPEQLNAAVGFTPGGQKTEGVNIPKEQGGTISARDLRFYRKIGYTEQEIYDQKPFLAKKLAAQLIDQVRVGITGKKPLDVALAEESLSDAMTAIGNDIDNVKLGLKPARDVQSSMNMAENALYRLERTQQGLNKENLRNWRDGGAQMAAEIILKKQEIRDLKRELLAVMIQQGVI